MSVTFESVPLACPGVSRREPAWTERPSRLKFSFAGVLLFSVNFRALVRRAPAFGVLSEDAADLPDHRSLPPGVRAVRERSIPVKTCLPRVSFFAPWIRYVPAQYRRFHVEIDRTFSAYLSKFSSKSRNTLRRKVRQFADGSAGDTGLREFRTSEDIRLFHRLAHSVSKTTYQHQLLDAGIPNTPEFETELMTLASRDLVRGYILLHSGIPVAYALCRRVGDALVYERTGFNPRFGRRHPGTVLIYLLLQHLFEQKEMRRFDFGPGEFGYKEYFATGSVLCADIYYFRRTLANCSLVVAHTGLEVLTRTGKFLLDRLGWTSRIKKTVHRALMPRKA